MSSTPDHVKILVYDELDRLNIAAGRPGGDVGSIMRTVKKLESALAAERQRIADQAGTIQRLETRLKIRDDYNDSINKACAEAGKTKFGTCQFIGDLADRVRQKNTKLEEIADVCMLLGMEIDGDPVDFLTAAIDDHPSQPTFHQFVFNILNPAA